MMYSKNSSLMLMFCCVFSGSAVFVLWMKMSTPTSADACLSIVHSLMCHRKVQDMMIFLLLVY